MSVSDRTDEVLDALVSLVQDVHDGHVGEDAAERHVRTADWPLTPDRTRRLVEFGRHQVEAGAPAAGYLVARLLMALSEQRWGRGMSSPWWQAADLLVEAVRLDLAERPSGVRLRLACAVADEQIEVLRQAGELEELAETMYAAGILRVHPHIAAPVLDDALALRERQLRDLFLGRLFAPGPGGGDDGPGSVDALPHPVDAAREALPYLYGAAGLSRGHEHARCLSAVNEALAILMNDPGAENWMMESWLDNCRSAVRLLDPARDPVNGLRLRRILAHYDGVPAPDTLGTLLPLPLSRLVRTRGERETRVAVDQALLLLRETGRRDPLRRLVAAVHTDLPEPRERERLWEVWQSHAHVLPGDPTPCPAEDTDAEIGLAFAGTLADPAAKAAPLVHCAAHLYGAGLARAARAVLDRLPDGMEDAAPEVGDAVRCLLGSVSAAAARAHRLEGEPAKAVHLHAVAACHYAVLGLRGQVRRELERMVDCADAGDGEAVMRAVVLLRTAVAPLLESGVYEPSAVALAAAAQRLGGLLPRERRSDVAPLMLHAAAKALDFSRALQSPGPRRPAPVLVELRDRVRALEAGHAGSVLPRIDDVAEDDLEMLCYAGPQEHASGHGDPALLGNLRRSFDRQLSRSLYLFRPERPDSGHPRLEDVVTGLPHDTVLISLWMAEQPPGTEPGGPDGGPAAALHFLTISAEGVQDLRVRWFEGVSGGLIQVRGDGYRQVLHPFAHHVASVRAVAQADPLYREVTRAGEEELDFGPFIGELEDVLARLHGEGKRHLCFWAHGPFHFMPFPLLRLAGRPLADDWTVTTVPSPVCVTGSRTRGARAGSGLVSLGAALGGTPWGLRPEPGLDAHAAAVAAFADGVTLTGPEATPASFLARAEGARYLHVAAHGAHSRDASWFQCLYLDPSGEGADGRLFGHDVLAHDLRGVDLVTLGACESALGRFDLADNPRGLPAAFLLAGARAVVGCLWPVRTDAATCFFGELHGHLAAHHDTRRAFRHAQTVTRDRFPQYRDWGTFAYHGGWTPPEERTV
ncbi:CHAT domain-containing protein [Streptomyces sp. NPDC127100]|uniref:CHAT domain-containing protein n=1 Tax=Streptomyces sp. NPDC127100 TaxID=3347138 RepID=UPI00364B9762